MADLAVVIPAFNEAARLAACLADARAYLDVEWRGRYRILVVDDGSADATVKVARTALGDVGDVVSLPRNSGKGAAVRAGMRAAAEPLRLFCDADGATPFREITRLLRAVEAGADVAIGSRAIGDGHRQFGADVRSSAASSAQSPIWRVRRHRHFTGRIFSALVNAATGLSFHDTQCGFKLFTGGAADAIFSRAQIDGFAFDVEVLHLAQRLGLRVDEIGVSWHEVAGSKVRLFRDSRRMLHEIARIRRLHG